MQSKALILPGATVLIIIVLVLGNMGLLPASVTNLWPIILVVAGLVGLTSYDADEKTATKITPVSVVDVASTPVKAKSTRKASRKKVAKKTTTSKKKKVKK